MGRYTVPLCINVMSMLVNAVIRSARDREPPGLRQWARSIVDTVYLPERGDRRGIRDSKTRQILVAGSVVGLAAAAVAEATLPAFRVSKKPKVASSVGLSVAASGIALRAWSIDTLGPYGSQYVEIQKDHRVVDYGPYAYIRHPAYVGGVLQFVGTAVCLNNWISVLACAVIPSVSRIPRIVVEETTLQHALGQPYRAYRQRTRRFIPNRHMTRPRRA